MFAPGPITSFMSDIPEDRWPFPPKTKNSEEVSGISGVDALKRWWDEEIQQEGSSAITKVPQKNILMNA